jgi:histidinol dehydrogenase
MRAYIEPNKFSWSDIIQRPQFDTSSLQQKVKAILEDVKENGDAAVREYSLQFDKVDLPEYWFNEELELYTAQVSISEELQQAIQSAAKNIEKFHRQQLATPEMIETMPGVQCWRKNTAIEKVGIYIPGGTAPLFSTVLMLAIPARLAGCKKIVLCSPPDMFGKLNPAIVYAAKLCGVTHIYKVGGVQAIAAMAYGTKTVPAVNKIFGPGNQYVTMAKQLVQQDGIAIDMPAGPSEVCVMADETANPAFVATDLLSQAEHSVDSQVLLIADSKELVDEVEKNIQQQLQTLPRKQIAEKALQNSKAIVFKNMNDAIDLINEYAPEPLIISCKYEDDIASKIKNAGSVFLGNYSPESVGDYASGTNHTLPTNGFAKAYSGVSIDSFVKKITFQKLTQQGLQNIGNIVELMAVAEGLDAHKNAVSLRLKEIEKKPERL